MKHNAATVEAVLGRKLSETVRHYEVKCLVNSSIAGARMKTSIPLDVNSFGIIGLNFGIMKGGNDEN